MDRSDSTDPVTGGRVPSERPPPVRVEAGAARTPVTVLVVEDSPIVRERLAAMITDLPGVHLVGQAGDGPQGNL